MASLKFRRALAHCFKMGTDEVLEYLAEAESQLLDKNIPQKIKQMYKMQVSCFSFVLKKRGYF